MSRHSSRTNCWREARWVPDLCRPDQSRAADRWRAIESESQGFAIDTDRPIHDRYDAILGHVHQLEEVDAGFDPHPITDRHKGLERRVAGPACNDLE
jgi:hypothetical protein